MRMSGHFSRAYCSECGEAPVSHALHKAQFRFEAALSALLLPIMILGERAVDLALFFRLDAAVPRVSELLARCGLGAMHHAWTAHDSIRTKALFEGAARAGVRLRHFRFFNSTRDGFFIAEQEGKLLVFSTLPRPRRSRSASLDWMDDKGVLKDFLIRHGIPTAEGGIATTQGEALALYRRVQPPVVVKPHHGTRGRHTTIGVRSERELVRAFAIAHELTPWVVVEKELSGMLYRITLIGGEVAAVATRDFPHVVGDGVSTIAALLEEENRDPRRDNFAFFTIERTERADAQLRAQGVAWDSIPAKGQRVILNDKVSRLHGTVTVDVTDSVHPDNRALFERIAGLLGDPLIGVDFIMQDIARPWSEQRGCGLVECNAMPYIDLHHYPYEGKPRDIAARLWEYVFAHHR